MKPKDIVDKLRDSQPTGTVGGLLLNDAADEIVRLREQLKCTRDALSGLMDEVGDMPADPLDCWGDTWTNALKALKD